MQTLIQLQNGSCRFTFVSSSGEVDCGVLGIEAIENGITPEDWVAMQDGEPHVADVQIALRPEPVKTPAQMREESRGRFRGMMARCAAKAADQQ